MHAMRGWMDAGWLDGWLAGWMDGWMDEWMHGYTPTSAHVHRGTHALDFVVGKSIRMISVFFLRGPLRSFDFRVEAPALAGGQGLWPRAGP